MRHLPLIAGGVLAAFVSASAVAQSFTETLAAVYNNSPSLAAQRAALRAIDEGVPQALSSWRPTLSFSSEYGWRDQTTSGPASSSDGTTHPFTNSLNLSQPLYRGGRTTAATQSAEANVLAGRAALTTAEQNVLFQGVSAYMDVVRDQAVVELNRNNEQRLRRQLEATRDRFRVGEITRTDVAQAEARLSRAISDRVSAEGNLASSRAGFRRVVGESPRQLANPPPLPPLPRNEDEAQGVAEEESPELSSALHRESAARHDIRSTSGALLPTVSLNTTLSRAEDSSSRDTTTESARVTLQLTVPLYEAGSTYSQVRQRKQIHQQRRLEVDDSRRQVREAVTRAWEALTTARASIVARRAEVAANRVALDGVQQEAEVGARTTLDVLDAEQELLDSQVALVRSQRDEYVAGFQLQSAIGRLSARRLGLPVDAYDPTENYRRVRDKWIGLDNGLD
jgi:outer membrane protein